MSTVVSNGGTHVTQVGDVKSVTMSDEKVELTTVAVDEAKKETVDATTTETPATEVITTGEPKKTPGQTIKGFFTRAKPQKIVDGTTDATKEETNNGELTTEVPKKEKKPSGAQWFARKPHLPKFISPSSTETDGSNQPQMTCGLNLIDRDEKKINDTVTLQFEDIFGEPEGYHSVDCAWKATNCTFRWVRAIVYKIFTLIFALPFAIIWAVLFAILTFLHVWVALPAGKFLGVIGVTLAKVWSFLVRSVLQPFFVAMGSCLGGINVARTNVTRSEVYPIHLA